MEARNKCSICGSSNIEIKTGQTYHFTESGLGNVYLVNVETSYCPDCKADSVFLPDATQLLSCLGEAIVISPGLMTGPEIRFLRKNLHMKINDFAKLLGVARATLSRWENGRIKLTKLDDRLVRSIYLIKKADVSNEVKDEFRKRLERETAGKHSQRIELHFPIDQFSCSMAFS